MLVSYVHATCVSLLVLCASAGEISFPASQAVLTAPQTVNFNRNVSRKLFYELEELARIVDISYCVGTTGIQKPFLCASRCQEFPGFELATASTPKRLQRSHYFANDARRHGTQAHFSPTHVATSPLPILHHSHGSWLLSEGRTLWLILSSTYPQFRKSMSLIRRRETWVCISDLHSGGCWNPSDITCERQTQKRVNARAARYIWAS